MTHLGSVMVVCFTGNRQSSDFFSTVLSTYATDADLRSDFCAVFSLAFVPIADIIMIYDAHNQASYKL